MRFFNRNHASQGFEALATISGFFACLTVAGHAGAESRFSAFVVLPVSGTFLLSILAAIAGRSLRVAFRSLLTGPFIASVFLAAATLLTEPTLDPVRRLIVASAFGLSAVALFLVLLRLRAR